MLMNFFGSRSNVPRLQTHIWCMTGRGLVNSTSCLEHLDTLNYARGWSGRTRSMGGSCISKQNLIGLETAAYILISHPPPKSGKENWRCQHGLLPAYVARSKYKTLRDELYMQCEGLHTIHSTSQVLKWCISCTRIIFLCASLIVYEEFSPFQLINADCNLVVNQVDGFKRSLGITDPIWRYPSTFAIFCSVADTDMLYLPKKMWQNMSFSNNRSKTCVLWSPLLKLGGPCHVFDIVNHLWSKPVNLAPIDLCVGHTYMWQLNTRNTSMSNLLLASMH